jgi:hypothetical protein
MAGILDPGMFGEHGSGGLFGSLFAPIANNQNAILGYLAGALQGGGLGESIGRGLQGFLHGGNLDLAQQHKQKQLALQLQSIATTYKALVDSGLPEPTARAAALNPGMLRTVAGTHFLSKPQLPVIGEEPLTAQRGT